MSRTGRSNCQCSAVRGQRSGLNAARCTLYAEDGFSMVEMMAAVVIVAVCLVLVFRVFSTCARAISEASYNIDALSVLDKKMSELRERVIEEDGLLASSSSDTVAVGSREFQFNESITEWISGEWEEGEGEESEEVKMCEVELKVDWRSRGRERTLTLKTFMPVEGFAHEF